MPDYLHVDRVVVSYAPIRVLWRAGVEFRAGSGIQLNVTEDAGRGVVLEIVATGGGGGAGMVWKGAWSSQTAYAQNEVVRHGGAAYVALQGSTNDPPPSGNWALVADDLEIGRAHV